MASYTSFPISKLIQDVIKQLFIKKKNSTNNSSCCYSQFSPLFGFFLITTSTDNSDIKIIVAHVRFLIFKVKFFLNLNLLIVFVHRMIMEFKVNLVRLYSVCWNFSLDLLYSIFQIMCKYRFNIIWCWLNLITIVGLIALFFWWTACVAFL